MGGRVDVLDQPGTPLRDEDSRHRIPALTEINEGAQLCDRLKVYHTLLENIN